MARLRRSAVVLFVGLLLGPVTAQESSLRDALRRGIEAGSIIIDYEPMGLPELIANSNLVARVMITAANSYEVQRDARIMTDYTADVYDILYQRAPLSHNPGDLITVRRHGGELTIDRKVFRATQPGFPPFSVGEEYVLVLKRESGTDTFMVVGGGQGTFRVGPDFVVRQVTHYPADTPEERPSLDLPVDELRSLILTLATHP